MTPLFTKLNWKGHSELVVVDAPASFEPELAALQSVRVVRDPASVPTIQFAIAFVTTLAQVEAATLAIAQKALGDAVVWFAYPKGTSKTHRCEFNRDTGWAALGAAGFEAVRQVAIDNDWSALRFRRVEFIKTMTRDPSRAGTSQGKARVDPKSSKPAK
jgi:hypothetical protein